MKRIVNLLHKDLSYKIQGIAFDVRKDFGLGHKEQIYQKAFEEELKRKSISYEREKAIKIFSPRDGKYIGLYRPDFIIDKKVIVEIKTYKFVPQIEMRKIYDYLRNSKYELGYLINFASPRLYIKRIIFTNNKKNWLKKLLVFVSLWLVLFSGLPLIAQGATLYLTPQSQTVYKGDSFIITAWVDTEGEDINAIEGYFSFSQDKLEIIDLHKGGSILSLWPEEPSWSNQTGKISFIGGIPIGFQGQGKLLSIIFRVNPRVISRESASIAFTEDSQVLLNDGLGTKAKLTTQGSVFTILAEQKRIPKDAWQEELKKDKTPPEPFEIIISQSPEIFEGKYFIVFSTIDKGTGIDHYEINEGTRDWKKEKSPYLLEDQSLRSIIKVRAIDKAGNERIAEYQPPKKPFPYWIILLIIVILATVIWMFRKFLISKP